MEEDDETIERDAEVPDPRMVPYDQRHDSLMNELRRDGIDNEKVLAAMRRVPRHELVPDDKKELAYVNHPLPIGEGQTISQPYIVGLMTQLADIQPHERVLEVGTGSGYQAAVLGQLAKEVYTIEIVEALGRRARADLERLELARNIHFKIGDGYAGWPEVAPFDAIVVTAAPKKVPAPLADQLQLGGKLVIPVGDKFQDLRLLVKTEAGLEERSVIPVRFVPMTGKAEEEPRVSH
jgi:protein-L-isoaspartate(D-aspartate) O-methyltransferase